MTGRLLKSLFVAPRGNGPRGMAAAYDPAVIQAYADELNAMAELAPIGCGAIGAIAGFVVALKLEASTHIGLAHGVLLGLFICGAALFFGALRCRRLRCEAQLALAVMHMEANTAARAAR